MPSYIVPSIQYRIDRRHRPDPAASAGREPRRCPGRRPGPGPLWATSLPGLVVPAAPEFGG